MISIGEINHTTGQWLWLGQTELWMSFANWNQSISLCFLSRLHFGNLDGYWHRYWIGTNSIHSKDKCWSNNMKPDDWFKCSFKDIDYYILIATGNQASIFLKIRSPTLSPTFLLHQLINSKRWPTAELIRTETVSWNLTGRKSPCTILYRNQ